MAIELTVTNNIDDTMPVSWALHSYFPVPDTAKISLPELADSAYLDHTDAIPSKQLLRKLDLSEHNDAVFQLSPDQITLLRPEGNLLITSNNAPTTIIWNPNILANTIADLGPDTHKKFVCVERGAALEDGWHLPAGETISANMTIVAA